MSVKRGCLIIRNHLTGLYAGPTRKMGKQTRTVHSQLPWICHPLITTTIMPTQWTELPTKESNPVFRGVKNGRKARSV